MGRKGNFTEIPAILAKLRGKTIQEVQNETQLIIQDLQKVANEHKFLEKVKLIDGKNVLIVLVVFLMTQLSGVNVLTSYMVDIFSSVEGSLRLIIGTFNICNLLTFGFVHALFISDSNKTFQQNRMLDHSYSIF